MEVWRALLEADRPAPSWRRVRTEVWSPLAQPLLAAVAAALLLHLVEAFGLIEPDASPLPFNLEVDRSLGEVLGYVILASIIAGLSNVARSEGGDRLLLAGAGLFTFALADDLLMIHERLGLVFADLVGRETIGDFYVRELGQLLYFAVVGVVVVFGWIRLRETATDRSRHVARWVVGLLVVFAGFAVVLDVLHEVVRSRTTALEPLLVAIEDGGELATLSLIASMLFARVEDDERADESITLDDDPLQVVDDLVIDLRGDARPDRSGRPRSLT